MASKILLVDDEAILALSESKMIEKHGFEVEVVYSGEKAVKRALSDPRISLILMDIDLGSGIDGTEAARRILKTREIPIIFLTSHSEKEYVDKVKQITGYGYVLKNSGEFILIESIHMAYKLFEAKQEAQNNLEKSKIAYQEIEARESRLQHINRVLLSIRNVNQVITTERNESTLLNKACQLLVETSGYHKAWIVLLQDGLPFEPYYHAGFDDSFKPMETLLSQGSVPQCARDAFETGEVQVTSNPAEECPGCPFKEFYSEQSCGYGEKATMTMQLGYDGHKYGWISVILPAFYSDNPDEIRLFEEIAGDLAFALHHIRMEAERSSLARDLNLTQSTLMAALDNSHAGIAIADAPDGKLRYLNDAGVLILGGSREKIVSGIDINQYVATWDILDLDGRPLDTDEVPLTRAVRYGETNNRQFIVRRDKREDRVVLANAAPIFDQDGSIVSGIVIFLDVTEYKQTEIKLRESEEKYKFLYENAPLPYQSLDVDGNFIEVNPAWLRTLGYTREEVIGRNFAEFLHPSWKPHFEKNFPAFKQRGYVNDVQFKIRHKKGEYRDISFEGCIGYKPDGSFRQTYCVFKDITEQKQAEERKTDDQLRFQGQMLESLDEAVIATDIDGTVLYLNSCAEWLYGWPREEAIGKNIMNVTVPQASQQQAAEIMQALSRGDSWAGDFRVHTKQGVEFLAHVTNSPVYSNEGELIGIIGISYDVTERRKTEREKEYLMSELNHRVKNNLALISSLIYLKDAELGEAADLDDLMGQIKAVQMVHEKLFQTNEVTHIDLKEYLHDLLNSLFSSLTSLPVSLECRMDHVPIETKTAGSIGLIINELATNAIKHGFNSE
ncbi:MAG: PAS domain S-box protein, partial [Spirochaetota bacterium]